MNRAHWILVAFWIAYYSLHSLLAATSVKDWFRNKMGKTYRYYRLSYTIFATITLLALLVYQYSFFSPELIHSTALKYISVILLVLPGMVIMAISVGKYFLLLSGIRSLYSSVVTPELKVNGIHRYVRHPLYSGTILFVTGLFFIFPTLNNLIAVVLLIAYVLVGLIFEERKLIKEFGKAYIQYRSKVPKLIPSFRGRKA
ncbi:MAG: methyltransferase family protein [Ginsengibacter sp.]